MIKTVSFRTVEFDLMPFAEEIAPYSIGFLKRNAEGQSHSLDCMGSGVLVSVGNVFGILTAAHVLAALPATGEISLVTFPRKPKKLQNMNLNMSYTERLSFGGPDWGSIGPDIAFLRLTNDVVGTLKSSNSFRNLDIAATTRPPPEPKSKQFFNAILGVIDERTHVEESEKIGFIIKKFEASFMDGNISEIQTLEDFDYCKFLPRNGESAVLPTNFGGMSGGGIWRVYYDGKPNEKLFTVEARLWGICYYQSELINGSRIISGHGPNSIYEIIIKKINDKWPEA